VNIAISLYGIAFLRGIGETLRVGDTAPEMPGFHEAGYLYTRRGECQAGLCAEQCRAARARR